MSKNDDNALQIVLLAIEIELRCSLLYQEWAQRFKPYDYGVSVLLEELADEEREHAGEFRALQEEISSDDVPENIVLPPMFGACMKKLETIQDHFFVTSPVMASTILETALEIEHFTCQLYKDLELKTSNSAVATVCHRLSKHEENHAHILVERLEFEKQNVSPN